MWKKAVKMLLFFTIAWLAAFALLIGGAMLFNLRTPSNTRLASSAHLDNPPAPLKKPVVLKIVTFNIWDMYIGSRWRNVRMPAIAETLAELEPDIAGLQESFIAADRERIFRRLAEAGLPHHRYFRSGVAGSGLSVISRFPIEEAVFRRYAKGGKPHKLWHGDWWAGKGVCLTRLKLPGQAGYIDFFNTHAHAGYRDDRYNAVRASNMADCARFITEAATGTSPAFVVGDFNTYDGEPQYQSLVEGAKLQRVMAIDTHIDHVFAVSSEHYAFEVLDTVPIKAELADGEDAFGLSDHTGYMSTVRVTPR